jgi:hypothetical protein
MGADLRNNTSFARISLVLLDDCLVKLEHARTQDRIRRYMFEAIESVVIWRRVPLIRILVCTCLLLLPGVAILFIGETFATVSGILLILLGGGLVLWYLFNGKTTIRIVRAGKTDEIVGIFGRGKVRSFRERLVLGIQRAQQNALARGAVEMTSAPAAVMPPPLPTTPTA